MPKPPTFPILYDEVKKVDISFLKKHFKKTYAGIPAKKYLQLMERIRKAESNNASDIEMLMMF